MLGFELIAAAALVLANGFFVASEFAIARVRPTQVDDWIAHNRAGAGSVKHAVDRIDSYLAACQLGITLASLGLGAVGERAFHHVFDDVFGKGATFVGIGVAGLLAFLIITLLHVVIGELAPKSAAISRTGPVVRALAPPMRAFYTLTKPAVDLFNEMGNLLLKPFGIPPAREAGHAPHTEDELRALIRQSEREGMIDPEEGAFTEGVLTFGDRRAREVMVARPEIHFVTTDLSFEEVVREIASSGLTRLPLCRPEGGLDDAVGIVHAKDMLVSAIEGEIPALEAIAREVHHVPDSQLLDDTLELLRSRREHLVLVVDEHGTTVGLITLEDILEEIVGEIEDEFDPDRKDQIVRDGEGLKVSGSTPVRAVAERLGVDLGATHEATMGGLVTERLGHMPERGEELLIEGHEIEVTEAGTTRVEQLRIRPLRDGEKGGGGVDQIAPSD